MYNNNIVAQNQKTRKDKPQRFAPKVFELPEQPVSSRVGQLFNFYEAQARGLKSASAWNKSGRELLPDTDPVGFVVTTIGGSTGLSNLEYAVLESLGNNQYRVVQDGWRVYAYDQTQFKRSRIVKSLDSKATISSCGSVTSSQDEDKEPVSNTSTDSLLHLSLDIQTNAIEQTIPKEAINTTNNHFFPSSSSSSFSLSSPLSLSLVSTISGDTAVKPNDHNRLGVNNEYQKKWELLSTKTKQLQGRSAYVPVDWKEDLGAQQEEAYCFFHLMRIYQFVHGLDDDDYVDMSFEHCSRLIPNYPKLLKLLLGQRIVERTTVLSHPIGIEIPRGIDGINQHGIHRAYGYRLADPAYRHGTWTKRPITKKTIVKKLEAYENARYPVQRWLKANNTRLDAVDPPLGYVEALAQADFRTEATGSVEHRTKAYQKTLKLIRDRTWLCTFDPFSRRYHNNSTMLKRELRQFLRVDDSPLVEIDIKAAQLLFLGMVARDKNVPEAACFLRVCEDDLYQYLAAKGGWSRDYVKEQLMQRALFSPNNSRYQKSKAKRLFDQEFPEMARFFRESKYGRKTIDNPKPHNKLARMAQKAEVSFVIFGVCERIRQERPECWVTTIHDSVLCLPDDGEYVRGVMLAEFAKLDVNPRLEVKQLCP